MTNSGDMNAQIDLEIVSKKFQEDDFGPTILTPMGVCGDIIGETFKMTRKEVDQFAVDSHRKALICQKEGWYKDEILPITLIDEDGKKTLVEKDEGPRKSTLEVLGKLKPSFNKNGLCTPGNSSMVADGASVVVVASRKYAEELGLPIIAKFRGFQVIACDPSLMGTGPVHAIPRLLNRFNLKIDDIDIFELNEAFATQCKYCIDTLKIP